MPAISVIIPVYNAEKYIAECLDSVFGQTLPPMEVIVIDDGSTDGTLSVLAKYADRIRLRSRENRGVCITLNEGIEMARGEWIAFLDADDIWIPAKLALQTVLLENSRELDACFGYIDQFVSPELPDAVKASFFVPEHPQAGYSKITMLVRAEVFERLGRFDSSRENGDFIEWYTRVTRSGFRHGMINEVLAHRRISPDSASQRSNHKSSVLHILKDHLEKRRKAHE